MFCNCSTEAAKIYAVPDIKSEAIAKALAASAKKAEPFAVTCTAPDGSWLSAQQKIRRGRAREPARAVELAVQTVAEQEKGASLIGNLSGLQSKEGAQGRDSEGVAASLVSRQTSQAKRQTSQIIFRASLQKVKFIENSSEIHRMNRMNWVLVCMFCQ